MKPDERPKILQRLRILDRLAFGLATAGVFFALRRGVSGEIRQRLLALGIHNPADAGDGGFPVFLRAHPHESADGIRLPKSKVGQHVPVQRINDICLFVPFVPPREHGAATRKQGIDGHAGQFGTDSLLIFQQSRKTTVIVLKGSLPVQERFVESPMAFNVSSVSGFAGSLLLRFLFRTLFRRLPLRLFFRLWLLRFPLFRFVRRSFRFHPEGIAEGLVLRFRNAGNITRFRG